MSDNFEHWLGRTEVREDTIAAAQANRLAATLDRSELFADGSELPCCWHWLYFLEAVPTATVGVDGHPQRGDFLPPVTLPRRMWAGSRLLFNAPIVIGDTLRRESAITDITPRSGRSGELLFVTVQHSVYRREQLLLQEEQDIVYREAFDGSRSPQSDPMPEDVDWLARVAVNSVLLFRYSALTFNAHRIHYDRDYAVREEGYPGLVVQGPLTATLLLEQLQRECPEAKPAAFTFRGRSPLTVAQPVQLAGRQRGDKVELWAGSHNRVGMQASVALA